MPFTEDDFAVVRRDQWTGGMLRDVDWSTRSVGAPSRWPQSLKAAAGLCLMSRFPMAVCWGADYSIIYNDAYALILGDKHPWAMGRPCFEVWSELAHIVKPMFDGVMATGEATWSNDLMLPMRRHGYLEEAYFTVSYSGVLGDSGERQGVLVTVAETTDRYLAERRLRLVRALSQAASVVRTREEVWSTTSAVLDEHRADVPYSLLYALDRERGEGRLMCSSGLSHNPTAAPPVVRLGERVHTVWPLARVAAGAAPIVIDPVPDSLGTLPGAGWPEPSTAAVLLPIEASDPDAPSAVLVLGVNPRRVLDEPHMEFFRLVAQQVATALSNAVSHEDARRRADALAELDRAKTAFFSNVSHEFRTPLTLLLGPLREVLETPTADPELRERLGMAHRNALRLLKLVNSLLDFTRIEAGRADVAFEPTDLATLTIDVVSVFRSAIERAGLTLHVACPPLDEPVFVDREMWEKVVLNLLSNAFKFTFEGSIAVSLRRRGHHVELRVADTGIGIPPEEAERIFDRFHRVKNARSRSLEGSGIGLALVRELVQLHGGSIAVEQSGSGGSTFLVTLRLGRAHLPADRVRMRPAGGTTAVPGAAFAEEARRWLPDDPIEAGDTRATADARVLVVDDNSDMREYLRRLLAQRYQVTVASNGQDALDLVRRAPPDLVVADVMMPGLDGLGLLAAIRGSASTRDVPVILLSARAGEEARLEGLRAGADDYLIKPFSATEFAARTASVLQLARQRRAGEDRLADANVELRRRILEQDTLLDVLPVGIGIATDRECRNIRVNRALCEVLRLPVNANASKTAPPDERPTHFRVTTTDGVDIPDDQLPMQVAARDGTAVNGVEFNVVHEDGRTVRLLEYAAPLLDEQGHPRGAVGAFVDITAAHEAQLTLARSEERYRRIFNTAGVSLWQEDFTDVAAAIEELRARGVADVERYLREHGEFVARCVSLVRVVDVNDASLRMFHAPDKAALRESLGVIFEPETGDVFLRQIIALARGDRTFEAEVALRALDGQRIHALMSMTFPPPGEPLDAVLVSLADITPRKAAESALREESDRRARLNEQLEHAGRLKDEFLATLSHELRTPLNAVLGWAHMLREGSLDPAMQQRALETLERNAKAQAQLVDDLLDVSRIISGKLHMRTDAVDLDQTAAEAVDTVRSAAMAKRIDLRVHLQGAGGLLVTGDKDRLRQVVWNLVSNAIKFTPQGGRIDVSVRRTDAHGEVVVRDTGEGIEPSFMPFLFERFRQMDASTSRRHGGLGLGLSIVRHLTEAHGGTVAAHSDGLGHGSTFTLRLPLRVGQAQAAPRPAPPSGAPQPSLAGIRALVVDDEPDARDLVKHMLEAGGAQVVTAACAGDALRLLSESRYDVLIADIGMPAQDGYSLIRVLRAMPEHARLAAIALTAYASPRERDLALEAGFNAHLAKPVDRRQLIATVHAASSAH